jgi:hypothetical protein
MNQRFLFLVVKFITFKKQYYTLYKLNNFHCLKFLGSNLNTVLPIIITFPFDLCDGPFRPFDGPFLPLSKFFDKIRPFSSWVGKNVKEAGTSNKYYQKVPQNY